jgi:hypothetical protein
MYVRARALPAPREPGCAPARADALLRVSTTTICGTDLHVLKGDVPTCAPGRILGHEGVGEARGGAPRGPGLGVRARVPRERGQQPAWITVLPSGLRARWSVGRVHGGRRRAGSAMLSGARNAAWRVAPVACLQGWRAQSCTQRGRRLTSGPWGVGLGSTYACARCSARCRWWRRARQWSTFTRATGCSSAR